MSKVNSTPNPSKTGKDGVGSTLSSCDLPQLQKTTMKFNGTNYLT